MAYPLSSDVTDGQPTAYQHYNNLRADALRFGQAAADVVNLGAGLTRYSDNIVLQPLATNRVRVPYSAIRPPTLMIDGHLCQAAADVDLAASTFSGGAATWYIFANWTAASTTFTLTANTSLAESAGQRRIAMIDWDGSNLKYATLFVYPPGRPGAYYAQVTRAAAQSAGTGAHTALSFDTEDADTDGMYAAGSPTKITIVHPGLYLIVASVAIAANATGYRLLKIKLNGTTEYAHQSILTVSASDGTSITTTFLKYLNAAEYIEASFYQNSGSSLNITGNLTVAALSA